MPEVSSEPEDEHMPTVIIPVEPVGADSRTESIPESGLEILAKEKLDSPAEAGPRYFFERRMDKRVDIYAFDPEKRTLKICRGAKIVNNESVPIGDIQILAMSVSREQHAEISYNGNECLLRDVGSKNGTYVNEKRLGKETHALRSGDNIRFGAAELTYRENKEGITTS